MEPFTHLTSKAAPLDRVNVDTDAIIPKQFLKSIERTGFGKHLFNDWRFIDSDKNRPNPEFVLNKPEYSGAEALVARENFGCGSSREHAPWALLDYGIRCVIAPSFADIFYNNSLKNGLLPAIATADDVDALLKTLQAHPETEVRIDLKEQIVSTSRGESFSFEIAEDAKDSLLNGLDDIGRTLNHEQEISSFESQRKQALPWL